MSGAKTAGRGRRKVRNKVNNIRSVKTYLTEPHPEVDKRGAQT